MAKAVEKYAEIASLFRRNHVEAYLKSKKNILITISIRIWLSEVFPSDWAAIIIIFSTVPFKFKGSCKSRIKNSHQYTHIYPLHKSPKFKTFHARVPIYAWFDWDWGLKFRSSSSFHFIVFSLIKVKTAQDSVWLHNTLEKRYTGSDLYHVEAQVLSWTSEAHKK